MVLEFLDGTQLEVKAIFGGPRLIMGVMRDVLRIEVDPNTIGFADLRAMFKENPNTRMLYTYVEEDGIPDPERKLIGEGYMIFVSISDEERKVTVPPGVMAPDQKEEIFVVQIAQQTYAEYTAERE